MTRDAAIGKKVYDRFVLQMLTANGYNHDYTNKVHQWLATAISPAQNDYVISIDDRESDKSNEPGGAYTEVKPIEFRLGCAVGNNREVIYEMYDDVLRFFNEELSYFRGIFGNHFIPVPSGGGSLEIYNEGEYEIAEMSIVFDIHHRYETNYKYDTTNY